MAAIDYTRTAYGSTGLFGRIGSALLAIPGAVIGWNDARVTRNALGSLSDRELDDIGLVRGDIQALSTRSY